jgi:hypothetical protein
MEQIWKYLFLAVHVLLLFLLSGLSLSPCIGSNVIASEVNCTNLKNVLSSTHLILIIIIKTMNWWEFYGIVRQGAPLNLVGMKAGCLELDRVCQVWTLPAEAGGMLAW